MCIVNGEITNNNIEDARSQQCQRDRKLDMNQMYQFIEIKREEKKKHKNEWQENKWLGQWELQWRRDHEREIAIGKNEWDGKEDHRSQNWDRVLAHQQRQWWGINNVMG